MPGGWFIGAMVLGMSVAMLTPLLTFDFRGDIDRLDLLKALPLPSWRIALGQLLAPTLLLTVVQLLVIALVQVLWGHVEPLLAGVAIFALPFNFLSIGIENLMFLWFPARQTPTTPGDFQMMGRQMLMMSVKFLGLLVVIVPAAPHRRRRRSPGVATPCRSSDAGADRGSRGHDGFGGRRGAVCGLCLPPFRCGPRYAAVMWRQATQAIDGPHAALDNHSPSSRSPGASS